MVTLDLEQLWTIHEFVRHQRSAPEYGAEWGEELAYKLWQAIVHLAPRDRGEVTDVDLSPFELKLITRQVSAQLLVGSRPIGREILLLAMTALLDSRDADDKPLALPAAFDVEIDTDLEAVTEKEHNDA